MKNFLDNVPSGNGKYIRIDDILSLQAGWQALEKVLKGFGEPFVIEGCEVSGVAPNNAVSAGLVFLDGKIHTLPAIPNINLGTTQYLQYLSNAQSDSRPLFGGGTSNTYETYLAQIAPSTGAGQWIEISQGTPPTDITDIVVVAGNITPLPASLAGGWSNENAGRPALVRKDKFGLVTLEGVVIADSSALATILQLPIGYRPTSNEKYFTARLLAGGNSTSIAYVRVLSSGALLLSDSIPSGTTVALDNISFYVNNS